MDIRSRQFDVMYMQIAYTIAQQSYAKRRKTGALLVRDRNILSYGYNGTPRLWNNVCEHSNNGETKREVLHAEANAILKCAYDGIATKGSIMYCTFSPCFECSKLIIQAGIVRLIYSETHSDNTGLSFLIENNVKVEDINEYITRSK